MILLFDSSAFVKVILEEEGSALAKEAWTATPSRIASSLALPECRAAFGAAQRAGRLAPNQVARADRDLTARWRELTAVDVSEEIASQAGDLTRLVGPLSGADAAHLATLMNIAGTDGYLVTWNRHLAAAARDLGVGVIPDA